MTVKNTDDIVSDLDALLDDEAAPASIQPEELKAVVQDLAESAINALDIDEATGGDLFDDVVTTPFTPDDYKLPGVGAGGARAAFPMGQAFVNSQRYNRVFKLSDYKIGYPSNNPLLIANNADPNNLRPAHQTYDPSEHDSSQALYDAITQGASAYNLSGFTLLIDPGLWCCQSIPTGSSTPIVTGTVVSSTSGTVVLDSGANSGNDNYNGCVIEITSGTGVGQIRRINDYAGGSRTVINDQAWVTPPGAGAAYAVRRAHILPIVPRMTIKGTGGWVNSAIIRGTNCNGDLFGTYVPRAVWKTKDEPMDILFQDITLDGGREFAYQGGSNDADTIATWDIIHFEKLRDGNLDDARLRVLDCYVRGAIRHCIYYQGRGDTYISRNRIGSCGDSAIRVEKTTDWHITDNIISGSGRHAIHISNSSNCELKGNQKYFCGQNTLNRWDGSTRTSVREHGTGMRLDNANNIRGSDNRIEDTSGHGIWISSAGDAIRLHNTYFHNLGCLGGYDDFADGYKSVIGFPNITTSNRNATAENKHVDGVDCIWFDNLSQGQQQCYGLELTGWIRQARDNQYTRRLVSMEPVNTRSKIYKDCLIDIQPGYLDTAELPPTILDSDWWIGNGRFDFFEKEFVIEASTTRPVPFERCRFNFMGRPMDGFGNRVRNLRSEPLNMWESAAQFALGVAAASANITAATWSQSFSVNFVTYTVDADLRSTLTTKHALRVAGAANAAHNGIWNINAITSTTIQVINQAIVDATDDFTGGSATVTGPIAEIVLNDAVDGQVYRIGVASMDGSAEDLVIRSLDTNIATTIGTVSSKRFSKDPYTGWYEVV